MFSKVVLFVLAMAGCSVTLEIEGIEKVDALLDGGITIHIDGIPDGGVPVRILPGLPAGNDDDAGQ